MWILPKGLVGLGQGGIHWHFLRENISAPFPLSAHEMLCSPPSCSQGRDLQVRADLICWGNQFDPFGADFAAPSHLSSWFSGRSTSLLHPLRSWLLSQPNPTWKWLPRTLGFPQVMSVGFAFCLVTSMSSRKIFTRTPWDTEIPLACRREQLVHVAGKHVPSLQPQIPLNVRRRDWKGML